MNNNAQKFIFLGVVIAVVLFSRLIYPTFAPGTPAAADGTTNTSTANNPPLLVLPSLTADVSAQNPVVSSSNANTVAVTGNDTTTPAIINLASTTPPNIPDTAELIANLTTGQIYLGKNNAERWPLASISKLMTAVVATNVLSPDDVVSITSQMTAVDPTQTILHVGDEYTVADLMHIMLLPSNNVAASALADFYGQQKFLAAMNAQAQAWGMTNTYYDDPSGLSAANESTANDLLKLAQNVYTSYPQIFAITRTPEYIAHNISTNQDVTIKSINDFAGTADFIGGKTGYTDQADGNLLSVFSYDNRPVLVVVLGTDDSARFDYTQTLFNWFKANFQ